MLLQQFAIPYASLCEEGTQTSEDLPLTLPISVWKSRRPILVYYMLALGISWTAWIPFGASQALPLKIPHEAAMFAQYGPSLAAIIVTGAESGKDGIRKLLRQLLRWRVGVQWYVFVLLVTPVVLLGVIGLHVLLGANAPDFGNLKVWWVRFSERQREFSPSIGLLSFFADFTAKGPWHTLLVFAALAITNGGLSEEFGWRGYALPRFQTRQSALAASINVGLLWAFWHTGPGFWRVLFTSGIGAFAMLAPYLVTTLALSILFTWVYNNTQSLLLPVLFHASYNSTVTIVSLVWASPGKLSLLVAETVLGLWVVALLVVKVYGPARLSRQPMPESRIST